MSSLRKGITVRIRQKINEQGRGGRGFNNLTCCNLRAERQPAPRLLHNDYPALKYS